MIECVGVRATLEAFPATICGDLLLICVICGPTRRSRKEVIQPQVPLRLPCYDFAPVTDLTLDGCPLAVGTPVSGPSGFHAMTGGVYKARERNLRGVAKPRVIAIPACYGRIAVCNSNLARLCAIGSPSRVRDALYQAL